MAEETPLFNYLNLEECVEKYAELQQYARVTVLYHHPYFKQFYFFLKGKYPDTIAQDLILLQDYTLSMTPTARNSKLKIKTVDFTNIDDQYGFENEIVFDISQRKYFKFSYGYLNNSEVAELIGGDDDELHHKLSNVAITENMDEGCDNESVQSYNPKSPDYPPHEEVEINEDQDSHILLTVEEAEDLEATIEQHTYASKVLYSSDKDDSNNRRLINEVSPGPSRYQEVGKFANAEQASGQRRVDALRRERIKRTSDRRREDRNSLIQGRRDPNKLIRFYPRQSSQNINSVDGPPIPLGDNFYDIVGNDNTKLKVIKCSYKDEQILISSSAILRSYVAGTVSCMSGSYFSGPTDPKLLRRVLNDNNIIDKLRVLRSIEEDSAND